MLHSSWVRHCFFVLCSIFILIVGFLLWSLIGTARSASVRAATAAEAMTLTRARFDTVLLQYPDYRQLINQQVIMLCISSPSILFTVAFIRIQFGPSFDDVYSLWISVILI
jgi:hypothetical protein